MFVCIDFAPFLIRFFSDSNIMEAVPILRILTIYIFLQELLLLLGHLF